MNISTNCTKAAIVAIKQIKVKKDKSTSAKDVLYPIEDNGLSIHDSAPGSRRYFLINQLTGTVIAFTNITAFPIPAEASTLLDIARNEHIPKKYARRIFSIKIDLVAKLR
tara:strand:- start:91 stop:420 length:330 start_codon:yes stop_codon:yes gene_type:complete